MSGPNSISDPVARRISYTESYHSAPNQLSSIQLGSRLMTWYVGPMGDDVSADWPLTWHVDVILHPGQTHDRVIIELSEEDAWGAFVCVDSHLVSACWSVQTFLTFDFHVVFTSVLFSFSSTWWYDQNTIWTTFIFEQKSNITLNQML